MDGEEPREGAGNGGAPAAGDAWYYTPSGSETVGPISARALSEAVLAGRIEPDTAVWNASLGGEWVAAGSIPVLIPAWRELDRRRIDDVVARSKLEATPPRKAFADSMSFVAGVLFRPFSILAWLSLALCTLMASSRMFYGLGDGADAVQMPQFPVPGPEALATLFTIVRDGVRPLFSPRISAAWLATLVFYGLFTSYVCAKGRMLLAAKAYFPGESLGELWQRTLGRTVTLMRFYFAMDFLLNFFACAFVFRFFAAGGLLDGRIGASELAAALSAPAALRWLVAAAAVGGATEFLRAMVYHFAEPLVFLWAIPVSRAFRLAADLAFRAPLRFLGFFSIVIACRATGITLIAAAALALPGPLLLPARLVILLPMDFLVRVFGTRFIVPSLTP